MRLLPWRGFLNLPFLLVLAGLGSVVAPAQAQAGPDVQALEQASLMTHRAQTAAMLAIGVAGARLVAVGERGAILLSDDSGVHWRQVPAPVSVTLTAVRFVSAKEGWATGHSGVVLATRNGGESWIRQLDGTTAAKLALEAAKTLQQRIGADHPAVKQALAKANQLLVDGPDKPFLDLYFMDNRRGTVIGAYGLVFVTEDGGTTWAAAFDRVENPKALHLNAIAGNGKNILIVGEQGLVLRSTDGGQQFTRVETPYRGSWFAVHVAADASVLVGGLRGNAYLSPDLGANWSQVVFDSQASITSISTGGQGRLLAGNQAASIFASSDGGRSFERLGVQGAAPLAAFVEVGRNTFVLAGLRGIQRSTGREKKS